jgi:hypothetical protein
MRRTTLLTCLLTFLVASCVVPASSPPPSYPQQPPPDPSGSPQYPAPQPEPQPQPQPYPQPQPLPPTYPQPVPMPTPEPAPQWDATGWTFLGEQTVDGRHDRDKIKVGRDDGSFSRLTIVVEGSDLQMDDVTINFAGGGRGFSPNVRHFFAQNTRTRVIDLPGDSRAIASIQFRYGNLPGGGRARVQVWGFRTAVAQPVPQPVPPPAPSNPGWDSRGWTLLGEQTVNGRNDRDKIKVGKDEGRFTRLTLVVLDSDLELTELEIKFGNGQPFRPAVTHYFRENSRTRVIDLPGDQRFIKWVELRYRNLPGGGRARVQLWAQ